MGRVALDKSEGIVDARRSVYLASQRSKSEIPRLVSIPAKNRGADMSHHYSGADFGFPHGDARLDFTDLYAFPKPGDAGKSILIMNAHPSSGANRPGPTTDVTLSPDAIYELKI